MRSTAWCFIIVLALDTAWVWRKTIVDGRRINQTQLWRLCNFEGIWPVMITANSQHNVMMMVEFRQHSQHQTQAWGRKPDFLEAGHDIRQCVSCLSSSLSQLNDTNWVHLSGRGILTWSFTILWSMLTIDDGGGVKEELSLSLFLLHHYLRSGHMSQRREEDNFPNLYKWTISPKP